MIDTAIGIARDSYQRCLQSADFIPAFYETFFEACPAARSMFAATDFTKQHKLLQHALGLLLSYGKHPEPEPNLLTRVAERHGGNDLKIDRSYYPIFVASLLKTARTFDASYSNATDAAWRQAIAPGVAYMASKS